MRLLTQNMYDLVLTDPRKRFGEDRGGEHVMILLTYVGVLQEKS